MSRRRWSLAGLCLVALGCDPMPSLETMQGQVSHGAEYCNWTPIASDSAALFDLVHIVGAQRPAECRLQLGTAVRLDSGAWRLTAVPVPPPSAAARCAA